MPTYLTWSFNLEFINGKEYHRAHCEGLRDILVPVGKRYIIWSMDRKLNPNSSFVSEMSKYMPQRPNALKTEDRPKRAVSPEPVDTTYRKVCKVKDAVVNDCVNKVVNSIPSDVKNGCKVCFQYLKKADDASFNVVSTVVDVTLGNVVRGLDWLDKSAEMSGAGVRRYLRDGLGIDQVTAQNIGDGLEVGMKMLISIVPAKTVNLASNASKRLVKLTPAGGPSNGFKFKFYDENVIYKEIKPTKGKAKGGFKSQTGRVVATKVDADKYLSGLTSKKNVLSRKGITLDGYEYYKFEEKCEYMGRTFKKGDYISRDTLHHEWEYFQNKDTHLGAIDPLTGKIKPRSQVKGRKLNVK